MVGDDFIDNMNVNPKKKKGMEIIIDIDKDKDEDENENEEKDRDKDKKHNKFELMLDRKIKFSNNKNIGFKEKKLGFYQFVDCKKNNYKIQLDPIQYSSFKES